jgi:ATP-dependent Clp protease adapter protein ClpS
MMEAHKKGLALVVSTHREHAELLAEQFTSLRLNVTIEPAE